jgi:hypothetical protein
MELLVDLVIRRCGGFTILLYREPSMNRNCGSLKREEREALAVEVLVLPSDDW